MKDRPILFSAPMVRAILANTKTQTRRVARVNPMHQGMALEPGEMAHGIPLKTCPYGQPGDRLWVRETWAPLTVGYAYRADPVWNGPPADRWRPSIHMPRAASRITLEVTGVRVEKLQDISEADAQAEGAARHISPAAFLTGHRQGYRLLWESINGPDSWAANPWVWVIEFKRI